MEPDRQVEIQLGHMCNNRCVFCVSGQRTSMGEALPLAVEPLVARIREAYAGGHRKITLLGGEPTLQPGFFTVVRECVSLGFEEIVLFTNGVKAARPGFIDEVRATGGRFTWRISLQGGTKESHERTTRKPGSFDRVLRTLEALRDRGERITVNMCVVASNFESVDRFPELLVRFGVRQLHLDMMRPADAGVRTGAELREMMPPYSEMVGPLTRMVAGFPDGFDVNIGNLPYCVAPELARWIHHDGQYTDTIAIGQKDELSRPWNKYFVKRRDKLKPPSCRECVFEPQCNGVFEAYERFHGTAELVPVGHGRLARIDPERRFVALRARPLVAALEGWTAHERGDAEIHLTREDEPDLAVALRRSDAAGAVGLFDGFGVHVLSAPADRDRALAALRDLGEQLAASGARVIHPLGDDALGLGARSIEVRLRRLRSAAPFGDLVWRGVTSRDGGRLLEMDLVGPAGERAVVWLGEEGRRATGGYRVEGDAPTPALVEGLRAVMAAVRA